MREQNLLGLLVVLGAVGCISVSELQSNDGRNHYRVQCGRARQCAAKAAELCPGGFDKHAHSAEQDMRIACRPVIRKPRTSSVKLVATPLPMTDNTASSTGRRACTKVIVLGPDQRPDKTEEVFALIERELIRSGVGVVSAAVTARVGESEARTRTVVERAVILAKDSGADCLLQVDIRAQPEHRYFILRGRTLPEVSRAEFDETADAFRWALGGRGLEVNAKVIDVQSAEVLAAVRLQDSDVRGAHAEELGMVDGRLAQHGGHNGSWVSDREDFGHEMIQRLVGYVRGSP